MRSFQTKRLWVSLQLLFFELMAIGSAHNTTYSKCQSLSKNPLDGCPRNTILVSQVNSSAYNHHTHFTTIQSAILSLPHDTSPHIILILPGTYNEQLNITRPGPLTLLGTTSTSSNASHNLVTVSFAAANINASFPDNAYTSVLTVAPTLDASLTGAGPTGYPVPNGTVYGNMDFRAYNIDFRNVGETSSLGPALAVSISYANAGLYGCGFYSYQDTVCVGKLGNAYFYQNVIAGQTDFLYGFGTAWVQSSRLVLRSCGGGITAWKGANTTFSNKYGVYIADSAVVAANTTIAQNIVGKCFLGRPWSIQHRSVFIDTYLDASINPAGYEKWGTTDPRFSNLTMMAEYGSFGPGFNLSGRLAGGIAKELTKEEVKIYDSPKDVFMSEDGKQPYIGWIDKHFY